MIDAGTGTVIVAAIGGLVTIVGTLAGVFLKLKSLNTLCDTNFSAMRERGDTLESEVKRMAGLLAKSNGDPQAHGESKP